MTVRELIAELQKLSPDAHVVWQRDYYDSTDEMILTLADLEVISVADRRFYLLERHPGVVFKENSPEPREDDDRQFIDVVRLPT